MGKSYKKAIVKDRIKNGNPASVYHKPIRRVQKQYIKQLKYDVKLEIPNEKSIVNDYNYSDYKIDYEHNFTEERWEEEKIKNRRK